MPDMYKTAVSSYVSITKIIGAGLKRIGVLSMLDRHTDKRAVHYIRSLFAVYDIDELVALDVPWWTYRAIDEVNKFLENRPNAHAFEYGSGASSIWLAKRVTSLTSVEHDANWFLVVTEQLSAFPHTQLTLKTPDAQADTDALYHSEKQGQRGDSFRAYVSAIDQSDTKYDLIVIDGRARQACLKHAMAHLATDGMIVFDNTKRERYRAAIRDSNMAVRFLSGLTPSLPHPDETALLTFSNSNA